MSVAEIIVVIAACAGGAIVQGAVGVGLGLVAGPPLVAVDPAFIPGPLLIIGQVVGFRHIIVEWEHTDWRAVRNSCWGLPVGIAAGVAMVRLVPETVRVSIIGGLTAAIALVMLLGVRLPQSRRVEIGGGLTCSFAGLAASLPGAPLAICYSEMSPGALRSTSSVFIALVTGVGLATLTLAGGFGTYELSLLIYMLPGMLIGLGISRWVRPYLDRAWFRPTVLLVALGGGLSLVIGQLV